MNEILIYIIKVNVSLVIFYLFYKLLFQRDTFLTIRRFYLLGGSMFSFLYPFISISGWIEKQKSIMNAIATIQLDELVIDAASGASSVFTLGNVAMMVYVTVAIVLLVRMFVQLISILHWRMKGETIELEGVKVIRLDGEVAPFSFFKHIFINPGKHTKTEAVEILAHEQTHVCQWHSVDVLAGRIQTILCWFNPASWLIGREIRLNLEFLADNQVLKSGFEPAHYQYHLLKYTFGPAKIQLTNQFYVLPIKKRITMMNSKKTKKTGLLKYLLIIPVALSVLLVSNIQELSASVQNSKMTKSSVKVVDVKEYKSVDKNKMGEKAVAVGRSTENADAQPDKKVYDVVDVQPVFGGGEKDLIEFLNQNIKYPVEAQKQKTEGRVVVRFIVRSTGEVTDVEVMRSIDPFLDAEAVRGVKSMPTWKPGEKDGKKVNVSYMLPVMFRLK